MKRIITAMEANKATNDRSRSMESSRAYVDNAIKTSVGNGEYSVLIYLEEENVPYILPVLKSLGYEICQSKLQLCENMEVEVSWKTPKYPAQPLAA